MANMRIVQVQECPEEPGIRWLLLEHVDTKDEHGYYLFYFKNLTPHCEDDLYFTEIEAVNNHVMHYWGVKPEDWKIYLGPDIR